MTSVPPSGQRGALHGLRVLEFTQVWAGPACGQILGDFGADVIKVETSTRPDISRMMGPFLGGQPDVDASGYNLEWNRNKRSVDLDLRDPGDHRTALELAADADVVIENFAPGVLDRLGLGYETIKTRNPAVVMASITGYGATGPDGRSVAYGQQIEAESGLMSVTGYEGGSPMRVGCAYPDYVAAVSGVIEIMSALHRREQTGEGAWLDISMLEATTAMLNLPMSEFRAGQPPLARGNRNPFFAPHGIYRCSGEEAWIAIECHSDDEWRALTVSLGRPDLAEDERFARRDDRLTHNAILDREIAALTAGENRFELAQRLQVVGVPATAVLDIADLFADEHLAARGYWTELDLPGLDGIRTHGAIATLEKTPAALYRRPPGLGEHSDEIQGVVTAP